MGRRAVEKHFDGEGICQLEGRTILNSRGGKVRFETWMPKNLTRQEWSSSFLPQKFQIEVISVEGKPTTLVGRSRASWLDETRISRFTGAEPMVAKSENF